MKLLILACFIAVAAALPRKPLGSEKCTWGPAYWCKNYKQAIECNAIEHCRRRVWKSNDLCSECKSVVTEIHNYAKNNGTEILALINLLCDQLGSMADECKAVVSLYGKTLLNTIVELTADAEKLCKEYGLCSTAKKEIHHTIMKVFITQLRSNPTITSLKSVNADYCSDCKLVFGEIKDVLEDKDLQKDIIGLVEQFCGVLGSFATECKSFVDSYGPLVLEELSSLIDPASICAELGLCNSTKKVLSAILLKPAAELTTKVFFPMAPGPVLINAVKPAKAKPVNTPKVSVECVVCEFMMRELDGILGENATKEEIEKALDELCSILPSTIKSECLAIVNEYAPEIVELLLQELKPSEICTELGLCNSGKKLLRDEYHVTLAVFSGRRDPEWLIKCNDPNYEKVRDLYNAAKTEKLTQDPRQMPSRLGYKGFLLREDRERSDRLILGPKTKELQKILLQTAPKDRVSEELISIILEGLDKE